MTRTPQTPVGERRSVPAREIEVDLPARPDAGRLAREAVTALGDDLNPEMLAKVRLLVTELVVAALGPGQTESLRLRVCADDALVRAELGPKRVGSNFVRPAEPRSWNLFLVDRIADRWEAGADSVWFELETR